jgi:5-methylcytosine-specific restriction endonuclease McrA
MTEVSLKLFYNYGRLTIKFHCGMRVSWIELNHDRDWVKIEDGYHCKVCGEKLSGTRRLFCSTKCEDFFNEHFRQVRTWEAFRCHVFDRDNGVCQMCGKTIATLDEKGYWPSDVQFICDHIIALCNDGRDWWEDPLMINFQTLCIECSKTKTRKDIKIIVAVRKTRPKSKIIQVMGPNGYSIGYKRVFEGEQTLLTSINHSK